MKKVFTDPGTRSRPERFHAATSSANAAPSLGTMKTAISQEVRFGGVRIAPATILAPMAGVTDTVFRRFIKHTSFDPQGTESACGLIMTEFTSADGIYRCRESKRKRYLQFLPDEHPISAQLFGSDPNILAEAAKIVEGCGFDVVDLNLGCPAKKVVKCNGGSGLLRDLPRIRTIFETVRTAVKIPFTVKFRLGWDDNEIVCVELARLAEDCGLQAVALHARTREQGYSGSARWEWIAAIKQAVKIPVIGNGDIRTPEDAALMVEKTGCEAVMIGRTAPSNPWIFRQIAQYNARLAAGFTFDDGPMYEVPTARDRHAMMRAYFAMLIAGVEGDGAAQKEAFAGALGKMKQFASWFTHGVPGGALLRKSVYMSKNEAQVLAAVDDFFERLEAAPATAEAVDDAPQFAESFAASDCG